MSSTAGVIVRFPPSPTGLLHIGNARIAAINYLFAHKTSGKLLLRFDDTDVERCKVEYKDQMLVDLKWLGIEFVETYHQSQRPEEYDKIFSDLLKSNVVYPCYETPEELEMKRKLLLSRGLPPVYDRASLNFTESQKAGRGVYYRFKINHTEISWQDEVQGRIKYQGKDLSDPVIKRVNGSYMYTFCSVVDDYLMNITNIIRGADHITNTAVQLQIFEAISSILGKKSLSFAHLPLFKAKEGKISKRFGGNSVKEMREASVDPMAVISFLASIGVSSFDLRPKTTEELIEEFDLSRFSKSSILFDYGVLRQLNAKYISTYEYTDTQSKLPQWVNKEIFDTLKSNIGNISEFEDWKDAFDTNSPNYQNRIEECDKEYIRIALELYKSDWKLWLDDVKNRVTDRSGKKLFMPLRLAITGRAHGPDMSKMITLIGETEVKRRLELCISG